MWNWLGITNEPKAGEAVAEKINSDKETSEDIAKESKDVKSEQEVEDKPTPEKMKDVASNIGSYLYTFASAASKKAQEFKGTVDGKLEKTIVGDFNRENEKFVQEKDARRICDAVPPWIGYHEEEVMKSQILALSSDERNFLRDPPTGVDFQFDLSQSMPMAMAVLKEDSELEAMRFKLVPKRITEERFWRNYFYRVSLIKQSTQLSTISGKESKTSPRNSSSEGLNSKSESTEPSPNQSDEPQDDQLLEETGSPTANEFASDAFDDNAHLSEEEKTQMLLGVSEPANHSNNDQNKNEESTTTAANDWELDKELQDELESFELVDDAGDDNNEWQKEIEDLLDEEEEEVLH